MPARFTPLASGSSGNACLIQSGNAGLLIDFGIGPRTLARRLTQRGLTWENIHAVVLSHTHTDHWTETTLTRLLKFNVPLYCHAEHAEWLAERSEGMIKLIAAGLVRMYQAHESLEFVPDIAGIPLPVQHDSGATFGFRFEGRGSLFDDHWALGYAADLGCWDDALVQALKDVDLLALEFNHDEQMQRSSGRPEMLIRRVLGDQGHLSNRQAFELLQRILRDSHGQRLSHVVPLHLSRECNRPELANDAASAALREADCQAAVVVALQHEPGPTLVIQSGRRQRSGCETFPAWSHH